MSNPPNLNTIRNDIAAVEELLFQGEEITRGDIINLLTNARELLHRLDRIYELTDQVARLTERPTQR